MAATGTLLHTRTPTETTRIDAYTHTHTLPLHFSLSLSCVSVFRSPLREQLTALPPTHRPFSIYSLPFFFFLLLLGKTKLFSYDDDGGKRRRMSRDLHRADRRRWVAVNAAALTGPRGAAAAVRNCRYREKPNLLTRRLRTLAIQQH